MALALLQLKVCFDILFRPFSRFPNKFGHFRGQQHFTTAFGMTTFQSTKPVQDAAQKQDAITLKGSATLVGDYLYCAINSILYMRGVYPAEMFEPIQKYGMCIFDAKDDELKKYLENVMKWARDWMMQEAVTAIVLVIVNPTTKDIVERWQFDVVCDKEGLDKDGNPLTDYRGNARSLAWLKEPEEILAAQRSPKITWNTRQARDNDSTWVIYRLALEKKNHCRKAGCTNTKPIPSMGEICRQIGAVLKQIVASVSILPATAFGAVNSFNILVYTKDNLDVPADWQESNPHLIPNAQQLHFRKIRTAVHQVDTCVTYKASDY